MSTTIPGQPSLRELNKERTRDALAGAAAQLLGEGGVDAVTPDAVAHRAGVSRRTFFNYFHGVEEVLTETCRRATQRSVELFLARPPGEPLADSVRAVLEDMLTESEALEIARLERAAQKSAGVRTYLREYQEEQASALAEGLSARLGPHSDPVWIAAVSGSLAGIVARVPREITSHSEHLSDAELGQQIHDGIVRALSMVFEGFLSHSTPTTRQD